MATPSPSRDLFSGEKGPQGLSATPNRPRRRFSSGATSARRRTSWDLQRNPLRSTVGGHQKDQGKVSHSWELGSRLLQKLVTFGSPEGSMFDQY